MPIKHSGLPPEKWIAEAQKMLRQLPVKVANTAHRHFARNFETESWEGQKWPARIPRAVRNEGRQLLRDTGTLFRALSKEVSGPRIRIYIAPPADLPPIQPIFRNNVGINPVVYSNKHPYFATLPASVMQQVIQQSEKAQQLKPHRLNVLLLDRAKQFDLHHTEGKTGRVLIHKLVDRNSSSFRDELQVAMDKARQGIAVEMLPELFTEEQLFFHDKIFPKHKKQPKQPDYRYPSTADYADVKKPVSFTENALSGNIRKAANQADNAIILLTSKKLSWKKIKKIVVGRMKKHPTLQSVEILTGNVRKTYIRKKLGV